MTGSVSRNRAQRISDREKVARLRLRGLQLRQIATEVGISLATVKRDLAKVEVQWLKEAAGAIDTAKGREIARLAQIEREAWAEWERSREDYSKEKTERITFSMKDAVAELDRVLDNLPAGVVPQASIGGSSTFESAPKVVTRETGGRLGDPKYLQVALAAHERRCKLLGLDAPQKVAPTDPTGEKPYAGTMSDAELAARIAELQRRAPAAA